MSSRDDFTRAVRRQAQVSQVPVSRVYQAVYEEIGRQKGISLYVMAKSAGCKPVDVAERRGWIPDMLEICKNMAFSASAPLPKSWRRHPRMAYQGGLFVDKETGEVLE